MVQLAPLFAVPFGYANIEDSAALNTQLRDLFLRCAADGTHYVHPRALPGRDSRVFESVPTVFRWPEECTRLLKEFCYRELLLLIGQLNDYDDAKLRSLQIYSESWFQVLRRGGFIEMRNHPMASWSGIYCVSNGVDNSGKLTSGMLGFVNPAKSSAMYVDPAVSDLKPPYSPGLADIKLEPGQLVLFPSWLLHDVRPYEGEGDRITIAFNAWFAFPATVAPN